MCLIVKDPAEGQIGSRVRGIVSRAGLITLEGRSALIRDKFKRVQNRNLFKIYVQGITNEIR